MRRNFDFTPGTMPAGATLTRATIDYDGSYVDSAGAIQDAAASAPRFTYDSGTLVLDGLLNEPERTNFFLAPESPVTHTSETLATGTYTLWVEGSGSVAVAGGTATITGAGTATDGSPVTFVVTGSGTVEFTVTGVLTWAQCEDGDTPSSHILVEGSLALSFPGVLFDGTNDYLTRGAAFTGAADTNKITIAFAFRWDGSGTAEALYRTNTATVRVQTTPGNALSIAFFDTVGANIVHFSSTSTFNDGEWHVVVASIDVSDATSTNNFAYFYVDDLQEAADEDIAQATIDAVSTDHAVGAATNGTLKFTGCLGAFLYHHGVSLDLTVEANRRKFWNADGTQADWGADGSTPLTVTPLLYLKRDTAEGVAEYIANRGSGGGMTENGALEISAYVAPATAQTRAADVLVQDVPDGTYHAQIIRAPDTTVLAAVQVSAGAGYTVPTSTSPLRAVILTPVIDRIDEPTYLMIAAPLTVEGGASIFPYAWGEVAWGALADDEVNTTAKVYLSTDAFFTGAGDAEPNAIFRPRLLQAFNFGQEIPLPGLGRSRGRTGIGAVRIANGDTVLDADVLRAWSGRSVEIKVGGVIDKGRPDEHVMTLDEYVTLFSGTSEAVAADERQIEIAIRDPAARLDRLIKANLYAGTGGLEGGADLSGQPKPKGFGVVYNASPAAVDTVNLVYQVHDGAIQAVDAVRDAGVALAFDADVADITTATPATGEYATSIATGFIKLGAAPAGGITVDFRGDATGSYVSTIADVIERIVTTYGPLASSDLDTAAFTTVDASKPYNCGFYTGLSRPTITAVLDQLMLSADGFWAMTRAGKLTVGTYVNPEDETADYELGEDDVFEGSMEALPTNDPIWRLRLGYKRHWTIQSAGELASSVSAADRATYSQGQQFVSDETANTLDIYPLAIETEISTLLDVQANAEAEVASRLSRQRKLRRVYRFTARSPLYQLKVGDVVSLTHGRFGLSGGKSLLVLKLEEDAAARAVRVTAWG